MLDYFNRFKSGIRPEQQDIGSGGQPVVKMIRLTYLKLTAGQWCIVKCIDMRAIQVQHIQFHVRFLVEINVDGEVIGKGIWNSKFSFIT